jgi:hypothetical protein
MYSIGTIIYGIPYTEEDHKKMVVLDTECGEDTYPEYYNMNGLEYDGSGCSWPKGWEGVLLTCIDPFHEINLEEFMEELKEKVTDEVKEEAQRKIDAIEEPLKSIATKHKVGLYIIWGTS